MLSAKDQPQNKRSTQTESKRMENIFQANRCGEKKSQVAILVSDKIDFKTKAIKRHKGHFIILKE